MHSSAAQSVPGAPALPRAGLGGAGAPPAGWVTVARGLVTLRPSLECPSRGDVGAATASGGGCGGHRARGSKAAGTNNGARNKQR